MLSKRDTMLTKGHPQILSYTYFCTPLVCTGKGWHIRMIPEAKYTGTLQLPRKNIAALNITKLDLFINPPLIHFSYCSTVRFFGSNSLYREYWAFAVDGLSTTNVPLSLCATVSVVNFCSCVSEKKVANSLRLKIVGLNWPYGPVYT